MIELEDGWLRHQNTYWRYEKLDEDATLGFRRTSIPIENWVNFVKSDLPVYRAAGINITSWIEYDAHVALQLEVQKYAEETAEIRVVWEVQPETIRALWTRWKREFRIPRTTCRHISMAMISQGFFSNTGRAIGMRMRS